MTLEAFTRLFQQAAEPLGDLESWTRLRGGAGWNGRAYFLNAIPQLDEPDGLSACTSAAAPAR